MPSAYVLDDPPPVRARSRRIREWLAPQGILIAGRYSEREYYNSHHAVLAGRKGAGRRPRWSAGAARRRDRVALAHLDPWKDGNASLRAAPTRGDALYAGDCRNCNKGVARRRRRRGRRCGLPVAKALRGADLPDARARLACGLLRNGERHDAAPRFEVNLNEKGAST
jgi:hypothetical protein